MDVKKITMVGEGILAGRPEERPSQTSSGLYVPEGTREFIEVPVVAVGPGRMLESGTRAAMEVEAGDVVLINRAAGARVVLEEEEYRLLTPAAIVAVMPKRRAARRTKTEQD